MRSARACPPAARSTCRSCACRRPAGQPGAVAGELMADVVLQSGLPAGPCSRWRSSAAWRRSRRRRRSPTGLALRLLPRAAVRRRARLRQAAHRIGTEATRRGASRRDDLAALARDLVQAGQRHASSSPATSRWPQLMPALEASVRRAGAPAARRPSDRPRARRRAGGKVYLVDKPDAPQSVIVAGARLASAAASRKTWRWRPVMRNFGGMATSRLNRNLRLDKHWSYGTSGGADQPRAASAPFDGRGAGADRQDARKSMLEVAKEIRGVAGERPLARRGVRQHHAQHDARACPAASRPSTRSKRRRSTSINLKLAGRLLVRLRRQYPRA